jgi:hypothetical protein
VSAGSGGHGARGHRGSVPTVDRRCVPGSAPASSVPIPGARNNWEDLFQIGERLPGSTNPTRLAAKTAESIGSIAGAGRAQPGIDPQAQSQRSSGSRAIGNTEGARARDWRAPCCTTRAADLVVRDRSDNAQIGPLLADVRHA